MGFKYPHTRVTLWDTDSDIVEFYSYPIMRENNHYKRPQQGSNKRKRMKRKLHMLRTRS